MKQELLELLAPLVEFLDTLDPSEAGAAATLDDRFPATGAKMQALAVLYSEGLKAGWLCDRDGGPGVRYSRVSKAIGAAEFSIDAVSMDRPGPGHTHPNGEFDLCFAADGEPEFDGNPPGWTVYPAGSWHVPTVAGGSMNILYFLPGGAIEFSPKPE
ncbi:MAG: DUF4863 family protein [Myxococcales bacterium]|nr:DUF4863 family protein [Myxococcales bacterium]